LGSALECREHAVSREDLDTSDKRRAIQQACVQERPDEFVVLRPTSRQLRRRQVARFETPTTAGVRAWRTEQHLQTVIGDHSGGPGPQPRPQVLDPSLHVTWLARRSRSSGITAEWPIVPLVQEA